MYSSFEFKELTVINLCNDGKIRTENGTVVGKLADDPQYGLFMERFDDKCWTQEESGRLWDQYKNNKEAFE